MTRVTRQVAFSFAIIAFLLLPVVFTFVPALVKDVGPNAAAMWVTAHAQSLPQSIIDVKQFPFEYRKRIVRALPPATQATLWREHLLGYLVANPALEPGQKEALTRAAAFCVPEHFAKRLDVDGYRELDEITVSVKAQFEPEEAAMLLYRFGYDQVTVAASEAVWLSLVARVQEKLLVVAQSQEHCSCNLDSDWCSPSPTSPTMHCSSQPPCRMDAAQMGCGTLWLSDCNGKCVFE